MWRLGEADLALNQNFQMISGWVIADGKRTPVENGKLNGEQIAFKIDGAEHTGRVSGDSMSGQVNGKPWSAIRK
jgi:hypothetical protein